MPDLGDHPIHPPSRIYRQLLTPSQQFAVFSLAILLLLGGLFSWFLSRQIQQEMAEAVSNMIGHQVTAMIRSQFTARDLQEPLTSERYRALDDFIHENVLSPQVARVKIWNKSGTIIYADDPALVGQTFPLDEKLQESYAQRTVITELASLKEEENMSEEGMGPLLEIYAPLIPRDSEDVLGVYEVYLYYRPIAQFVRKMQTQILGAVVLAFALLWGGLYWVFARATRAIFYQRWLAITDPLTSLFNRRYLLERMEVEVERFKRYRAPYSLILLDIDHFKKYNDTYGHPAGDIALRELAIQIQKCVRSLDVVARYGGEEFAVLLPATDLTGAVRTAQRISESVAAQQFLHGSFTVSLGVACSDVSGQNQQAVIQAADTALYRAKEQGRNQFCLAQKE